MAKENSGHRARMRERMLKEGLDSFQDHEVLELLLYQYLPYKDTNKIAHNLLNKFGGFAGVLNASPEQLMSLDGISDVTACNIAMLKEVLVRYRREQAQKINLAKMESMIKYARTLVIDNYCERLVVVYVDYSTNYLFREDFTSQSSGEVVVEISKIVSTALRVNAAGVILFHCHVHGVCKPSKSDEEFTRKLFFALTPMNVMLIEHIIFNDSDEPYSFHSAGFLDKLALEYKKIF